KSTGSESEGRGEAARKLAGGGAGTARLTAESNLGTPHACDQATDERQPGGVVLGRDDIKAERLAEALGVDADRVHDADVDGAAALAALHHQRVQGHVSVGGAVERAGAEVLDDLVEALRQPRDLALAHPLDPELLHELLDPAGRDAGEVGVGDHRHERLLRTAAAAAATSP